MRQKIMICTNLFSILDRGQAVFASFIWKILVLCSYQNFHSLSIVWFQKIFKHHWTDATWDRSTQELPHNISAEAVVEKRATHRQTRWNIFPLIQCSTIDDVSALVGGCWWTILWRHCVVLPKGKIIRWGIKNVPYCVTSFMSDRCTWVQIF